MSQCDNAAGAENGSRLGVPTANTATGSAKCGHCENGNEQNGLASTKVTIRDEVDPKRAEHFETQDHEEKVMTKKKEYAKSKSPKTLMGTDDPTISQEPVPEVKPTKPTEPVAPHADEGPERKLLLERVERALVELESVPKVPGEFYSELLPIVVALRSLKKRIQKRSKS
jgi:hypothetical protein